jgi:hypothetical protein
MTRASTATYFLLPTALFLFCLIVTLRGTAAEPSQAAIAVAAEPEREKVADPADPAGGGDEASHLTPDVGNLRAFVELARTDIQLRKAVVVAQNLPLTEEEAAEFWPIHREYEQELAKLNDRRIALIRKYLPQGGEMSDTQARDVAAEVFDLESKRTELKRTYFERFQQAVPATKAARFFQIENQLTMVLELRIAAALPLIK